MVIPVYCHSSARTVDVALLCARITESLNSSRGGGWIDHQLRPRQASVRDADGVSVPKSRTDRTVGVLINTGNRHLSD